MKPLLVSLVLCCSCATPAPPKVPFAVAAAENHTSPPSIGQSVEHFVALAVPVRKASPPGAPMPAPLTDAWVGMLDEAESFLAEPTTPTWSLQAMRLRLQLESEFQADAQTFGDIPAFLAERVPSALRKLSTQITQRAPKVQPIDPRTFLWPVAPVVVSSPYGTRMHPIALEPRFHAGVDLEAPRASPVRAAARGVVVFSGWNGAHGRQVEVQHDGRWSTRYSHLETLKVKVGTQVKPGDVVGRAGASGLVTGPHLHFELRCDGDALDPEMFLELPAVGPPLMSEAP